MPQHDAPAASRGTDIVVTAALTAVCLAVWALVRGADAKVRERTEQARRSGCPMTLAELDAFYARPAPADDAAPLLMRAFERMSSDPPAALPVVGTARLPPRGQPLPEPMRNAVAKYLGANREALDLIREASQKPGCRFPVALDQGFACALPHLAKVRSAARLLQLDAVLAADAGRRPEAVRSVLDSLALSDLLRCEPLLISQLVRMASLRVSFGSLERVLSAVPPDNDDLIGLENAVRRTEDPDGLFIALAGERCMGSAFFSSPSDQTALVVGDGGGAGRTARIWRAAGLSRLDHAYYLAVMAQYQSIAEQPVETRMTSLRTFEASETFTDVPRYCVFSRLMLPALGRVFEQDTATIALTRCAAAAMSVERFRNDTGRLPGRLEDLVPGYLPLLPLDPFDGKPLRYRLLKPGYVVYSIGDDLVDDGGAEPVGERAPDVTFTVAR